MADWTKLTQAVGELEDEVVKEVLSDFMKTNPSEDAAQEAVAACQAGMAIVGDQFESGEFFVGDLIFAGELLSEAIDILKPALGSGDTGNSSKILLGTVHGDMHDIGKNIFKSMAEAAGFQVKDLGIDVTVEEFVTQAKTEEPDIIGFSGVLTLAIESMKHTVDALKEAGIESKIIIGGNPVTKESCEYTRADAFTTNAAQGIKICQNWIG